MYGIDMPTREELIANGRSTEEIAKEINADVCIFQDLADLEHVIRQLNPQIEGFDSSCFSGCYVTGDVDEAYLKALSASKKNPPADLPMPTLIDYSVSVEDTDEDEQ